MNGFVDSELGALSVFGRGLWCTQHKAQGRGLDFT